EVEIEELLRVAHAVRLRGADPRINPRTKVPVRTMVFDPWRERNVAADAEERERIGIDDPELVVGQNLGERPSAAVSVRRCRHNLESTGHADVTISAEALPRAVYVFIRCHNVLPCASSLNRVTCDETTEQYRKRCR